MADEPRIVIVGAGVSGIATATSLLDRGFQNVKIIEAENRIGGRVCSIPFGKKHVDLGAHWVHGELDNPVYDLVKDLELLHSSGDLRNMYFVSDDGRSVPTDQAMSVFLYSAELLEDEHQLLNSTSSLEEFLMPKCREFAVQKFSEKDLIDAFINWLTLFECTLEGCDQLSDSSAAGHPQYKQCEGDNTLTWNKGGYYNIIEILLKTHPKCLSKPISLEDKLVLNTVVTEIDWSGLTALVKCSNGECYKADHVVVTVSLGVLKEKYRTLFTPSLPIEKIRSIVGLGFGTVDKIYIKFAERWWPEDSSGFSLLWTKNNNEKQESNWENKIIGFYGESAADPTVLAAWLIGSGARDMEACTDKEVLLGCHRVLKKFLHNKYDIPEPVQIVRSQWYSNNHFRGSYSYRSMNSQALETGSNVLAQPLRNDYDKLMILFAGEATHSHFYSTVHGAMESGWREAKRIIDLYANNAKL